MFEYQIEERRQTINNKADEAKKFVSETHYERSKTKMCVSQFIY